MDIEGQVNVYIPTLKRVMYIVPETGLSNNFRVIYYLEENCVGQGYAYSSVTQYKIFINNNHYYNSLDTAVPGEIFPLSSRSSFDENCSNNNFGGQSNSIPVHEVTLPFTMPVSLPMHFE